MRNFIFILNCNLILLCGCVNLPVKNSFDQSYRQSVQKEIEENSSEFQGGNFPYYHWAAPIVQEVSIPAHVNNGVMIPMHNELVIIKPGEWVKSPAYPIQSQERYNNENKITYVDMDVSNITALPRSSSATNKREE